MNNVLTCTTGFSLLMSIDLEKGQSFALTTVRGQLSHGDSLDSLACLVIPNTCDCALAEGRLVDGLMTNGGELELPH